MLRFRAVVTLLAACLLLSGISPVRAAGPAIARPEPRIASVRAGELTTVKLYIENAADLYGADIVMEFDPALLEVQDADPGLPGTQITPLAELLEPGFVIKRVACNVAQPGTLDCPTAGRVWYAVTQLNPSLPVTGSGGVAAITFRALKPGTSPLKITAQKFADREGIELPSVGQHGTLTVTTGVYIHRLLLPVIRR